MEKSKASIINLENIMIQSEWDYWLISETCFMFNSQAKVLKTKINFGIIRGIHWEDLINSCHIKLYLKIGIIIKLINWDYYKG